MRIVNNSTRNITLSYSNGTSYEILMGSFALRPASDLPFLGAVQPILSLFNSGALSFLNDDGSAYTGSPLPTSPVVRNTANEALSLLAWRWYPADASRVSLTQGPVDASGNGLQATLNAGLSAANCYANSGYFSTVAGATGHVLTDFTWDFSSDIAIIAAVVNWAAPGTLSFCMGNSVATAAEVGFAVGASTGLLRLYVQASGSSAQKNIPVGTLADGTDHDLIIAYDYRQRALYVYVDGVLALSEQYALSLANGVTVPTRAWTFGSSSPSTTSAVVKFKQVNLFKMTGGVMPVNLNAIAAAYHTAPGNITAQFNAAQKSLGLFVVGQSNETGQGVTAGVNATGAGTPLQDPCKPNGQNNKRSWAPSAAPVFGAAGYKVDWMTYALGGTGIRDSWIGYLDFWTSGGFVKQGSYRISDGAVWRCALADQVVLGTCANAPTGIANVTGADTIPWVYVSPWTSQYPRGLQARGGALYDPNGNIAALVAGIRAYDGPRKVVHISFGQTDSTLACSRADYAGALIALTQHVLSVGATKVGIGQSLYGSTVSAYYDSTLVPGVLDALAAFSSDARVFAGLNFYKALGVLPTNPASGLGLQNETPALHGNDAAYDVAGPELARQILAVL